PACIVCTEFFNEVCIRRARQFGASSFLCKPVRRQSLYDAIIESVNAMGDALMECDIPIVEPRKARATAIADYLAARGIPRQSYGFRFLCDAVTISRQNPGALTAVTKSLYPEIARINESTPARVERDIRSAILHAYRHSNLRVNGARPTNREFIQLLADQSFDSVELI
ncbi:MAG: sporulation initiation factor Spo0A C-terminal domain-containing protein, partial [Christensenellales bacterium]